MDNLKVQ